MKTPRYQLTVRAVAAAAIALAGSFSAVPAMAEVGGTEPAPATSPPAPSSPAASGPATSSPAAPADPTTPGGGAASGGAADVDPAVTPSVAPTMAPEISDAGLAEAVRRDLGMTLEEFNAAGQLARTAADAVPSLREFPGYVGISLRDGRIVVEGSGAGLQALVDELNGPGTAAVFDLVAPAAEPSTASSDDPLAPPVDAPTSAPSAAELVAANTDQLFQAYIREVGPAGLQAVAYSGGRFIIRTGGTNAAEADVSPVADQPAAADQQSASAPAAPAKISPADFVARYANVQLEQGSPVITEADVYGGEGYAIDRRTICSTGFGAFSTAGLPVVLTAGHCAEDGAARIAELEPPTSSTAGGSAPLPGSLAPLGSFGFSQFGGPLNSWVTGTEEAPGNVGTDIAVIEGLNGGLDLQAAATTWVDAVNPGATAVKIIGMVAPFQGQEVCRSGRTEGWSCGQVEETGIYVVGGRTTAAADLRAFRGFLSKNVQSRGGDSGGPWISGNFAVGTHSAGETSGENFAIATTLEDALTHIPTAVQLQLFLNKPELVAPDNLTFMAGQPITGRVPAAPASAVAANSKVLISVGNQTVEAPVDAAGNWTYPAPEASGPLTFKAETANGFSRSGPVTLAVNVTNLDAPVITTPAEGAALKSVGRIDGTGTPGLTVKLTGDISGSAFVGPDGHWTIPVEGPGAGRLSIHAVQTSPGETDSASVTRNFTVAPAAPAVTTIVDGSHLSQDALPGTISGTGVANADVAVLIDGVSAGAARAGADGSWSVPFPAGLTPGEHTLSATQSVDGVASDPLLLTFTVDAPAVAPAEPAAPVEPAAPAAPGIPAAQPVVLSAGSGQLPDTGAGSLLPLAGLAGGAVLLGGVLLGGAAVRRRATN
ncbi:S1 family peptidase [Arthrobacter sp. U41]|uniref:S1 family peptidase n=1 Tax=Arthrobacter sp. U41 TaxID=1849032 RepID=UPI0008595043|nr:S1 family peptidase [Arthrobacter sp. U41]AOT02354.1 hypothetical protein ASPU41_02310 [Arthrobacter sp. U41]